MGNFSDVIFIKAGSLQPVFTVQILQSNGVTPVDLSAASAVKFRMRTEESSVLTINNAAMTIVSPATQGTVQYSWQGSDTATAGRYLAEIEIDFPTQTPLVMPPDSYYKVVIIPTLP